MHRSVVHVKRLAHQRVAKLAAAHAKVVLVPVGNVRARGHEFHDARHHGLAILRFDNVDHMVVGVRLVLDEDFAHHTDAHLARLVLQRQRVEGFHNLLNKRLIRQIPLADEFACRLGIAVAFERFTHDGVPRVVQLIRTAWRHLVRAYAIQAFHQQITDNQRLDDTMQQCRSGGEARIVFDALRGNGDHWNLRIASIDQCLADQAEIVRGSAHAAGLCDGERSMFRIILAVQNRVHELTDDHDGRVAGVVVDVFQTGFHVFAAGVFENIELVTAGTDHGFHQGEVDRAHLRSHDGVVLHVFAEWHAVGVLRHGGGIVCGFLRFADAVFRGTPGCGFDGFGEFRIGFHHGVKHDLTSRSRRLRPGLAEFATLGIGFGGFKLGLRFGELRLSHFQLGFRFSHGIRLHRLILLAGHGTGQSAAMVAFTLFDGCFE